MQLQLWKNCRQLSLAQLGLAQLSSARRFIMKTFNLSSATSARESFQHQPEASDPLLRPLPRCGAAALIINFKCQAASRAILWYLLLVFNYVAALWSFEEVVGESTTSKQPTTWAKQFNKNLNWQQQPELGVWAVLRRAASSWVQFSWVELSV